MLIGNSVLASYNHVSIVIHDTLGLLTPGGAESLCEHHVL